MARADQYLALLDGTGPGPSGDHPSDPALLAILVHVACSDGLVQEEEFAFLEGVLPGKDAGEILNWVAETATSDVDWAALGASLGDADERRGAMRFATRLAWADQVLDANERALLLQLATAMGLPASVVDEVVGEVIGFASGPVSSARVLAAVDSVTWHDVRPEVSALFSELAAVVPAEARPVARLMIDGIEKVGLYDLGLAAQFVEGPRFIRWTEIRGYIKVPVLGAAVRVDTADGASWTVSDTRLRDVGAFLDRVYAERADG